MILTCLSRGLAHTPPYVYCSGSVGRSVGGGKERDFAPMQHIFRFPPGSFLQSPTLAPPNLDSDVRSGGAR